MRRRALMTLPADSATRPLHSLTRAYDAGTLASRERESRSSSPAPRSALRVCVTEKSGICSSSACSRTPRCARYAPAGPCSRYRPQSTPPEPIDGSRASQAPSDLVRFRVPAAASHEWVQACPRACPPSAAGSDRRWSDAPTATGREHARHPSPPRRQSRAPPRLPPPSGLKTGASPRYRPRARASCQPPSPPPVATPRHTTSAYAIR